MPTNATVVKVWNREGYTFVCARVVEAGPRTFEYTAKVPNDDLAGLSGPERIDVIKAALRAERGRYFPVVSPIAGLDGLVIDIGG